MRKHIILAAVALSLGACTAPRYVSTATPDEIRADYARQATLEANWRATHDCRTESYEACRSHVEAEDMRLHEQRVQEWQRDQARLDGDPAYQEKLQQAAEQQNYARRMVAADEAECRLMSSQSYQMHDAARPSFFGLEASGWANITYNKCMEAKALRGGY